MDKVRWGLISTASINRKVIPAIRNSRRGELVAVASRTMRTAVAYAKRWEIPRAFGSYDQMLQSGQVDAVYIGLPNHLHSEWSIRAMQAGYYSGEIEDMHAAILDGKPPYLALEETRNHIRTTLALYESAQKNSIVKL